MIRLTSLSRILLAAMFVLAAGSIQATTRESATVQARHAVLPSKQYRIEDFIETTGVSGAAFSADESRILFSSDKSGVWNAYSMPIGGGDWTAITRSATDNNYAVAYFPGDDRVLVTRNSGGDELNHLYVIGTDGQERDLTPGEKLKAEFVDFSHDGRHFYVISNERDPKFFDLYRYDSATYARERVYENRDGYEFDPLGDVYAEHPVSPDGRWLALSKVNSANDFDLFVVDLRSGATTKVSEHAGEARFFAEDFSCDSRWLYYTANDAGEFTELRRVNLATWQHEPVHKAGWDIDDSHFSHDGKYRVDTVNKDGNTAIEVTEVGSGRPIALPALPAGEIRNLRISRSERRMVFYLNGDRQPNDLYMLDFGGQPRRLTRSLNPAIDPKDLVDSGVVRFKSFDGLEIPNILWKPHQATAQAKAPALVWVHCGPGGQTTRAHSAVVQYLANHGYVVLGINNRGSAGYGKTLVGHSAGGHLALWAASRDRLPATSALRIAAPFVPRDVVAIAGVGDLESFAPLIPRICGPGVGERLVGMPSSGRPDVYADTSPAAMPATDARIVMVSGILDRLVPPYGAHDYAQSVRGQVAVELVNVRDAGHFDLVATGRPWHETRRIIQRALARRPR